MTNAHHIHNFLRIDERVTTSGQPTEEQLGTLAAMHVQCVINLGLHSHERALADEAGWLAARGIAYINIPVDFAAPTEANFERFCAAMAENAGRNVHVHCIMNMRVTAFLYRWQREVLGLPELEARAFMDKIWRPGGVWARFIGDTERAGQEHISFGAAA